MALRVGVDIGGTFTDLVALDEGTGRLALAKRPTTPKDLAEGVLAVLNALGRRPEEIAGFVHGSTVTINAIVERRGARVALVTTVGFRDSLEIGRANRPDMFNFLYRKPAPFVPRRLRFEVRERIDARGVVVEPLREEEVAAAAEACRAAGVESVAVCFLHAYVDPTHERRAATLLRAALPGVPVTASTDLSREWREYERASTAVLNAYVAPLVAGYLTALGERLRAWGLAVEPRAMMANGGVATFPRARQVPLHLLESGPVAGVLGAAALGRLLGLGDLITLDIGGTTAKTSLLEGGRVAVRSDYRLEASEFSPGYPIALPIVDIVEIGAGGGSIAWIDEGGGLHVGPRSAGADPGPACYGLGGREPTLTDAHLLAGSLNPAYFLGGELPLDPALARHAFGPLAAALGLPPEAAALGVLRLAVANMVEALKLVSIHRGHDPRDFVLVAFGGAGPMHAALAARELHIGHVLIPPAPAHFSAWGMLAADARHDLIATELLPLADAALPRLWSRFAALEAEAASALEAQGLPRDRVAFARALDMRYVGQYHVVEVPLPPGRPTAGELGEAFHRAHRRRYAFALEGDPVEVVNLRLHALVPGPGIGPPRPPGAEGDPLKGEREVLLLGGTAPVYARDRLAPGASLRGPAVVEEPASTTLVLPGQRVTVDGLGNLVLREGG